MRSPRPATKSIAGPNAAEPLKPSLATTDPARRHVLDLDDFSRHELEQFLETTDAMREILDRPIRKVPALRGKTIITLFFEPSTRTRVSFEQAGKIMSADVINVSAVDSSVRKGESLVDTVRALQAMRSDVLVVRHAMSGAPYVVAQNTNCAVINAGDGWHAHPSQALLDMYTIRQRFGQLEGLHVVIVGDILHSRVARSNVWGLTKMGATVTLCGPPTLLPSACLTAFGETGGLTVEAHLDTALREADVVMPLRVQAERHDAGLLPSEREYVRSYQVNEERLSLAKQGALLMHPGPVNEGVEVSQELVYGDRSLIHQQVTNGVAVRMALLYLLATVGGNAT